MPQRSDQHTRSADVDLDELETEFGLDNEFDADSVSEQQTGGRLSGLSDSGLFSPRSFLLTLILMVVGLFVGGAIVPFIDALGGLFGVFAAGFGLGMIGSKNRYVEVGLSAALVMGIAVVLGNIYLSVVGVGLVMAAVGAAGGAVAALVGHYFGRDLRDGLTREI